MIVDERMVTYIHSLESAESEIIEAIEQEALDTYVPIIRKETQSFLKVLLMKASCLHWKRSLHITCPQQKLPLGMWHRKRIESNP